MPKSIWNGTITFGLVAVPIKVYSATENKTVSFREVHAKDGSKIEHRRICTNDGKVVDYKDIVKGYEVSSGKFVELTDEEIAAAAGSQSKRLDVDHFVPADEIDPDFYERTYYLGAGDKGKPAYALLHAALEKAARAGVGRWIFHNRERTVVIRPLDGVLALHTMRFADELVDPGELDLPRVRKKPSDREIKMAASLVESLHTEFDPTEYEDSYRRAVLEVIEAKAEGRNIAPPEEPEPDQADDLLAALEASLASA
jgi:DNA end-binding protein Ku